jgi:putative membrane protein
MMHLVQMLIFIGAFGDKVKISDWERWSILLFGIFALLDIRRKHMM